MEHAVGQALVARGLTAGKRHRPRISITTLHGSMIRELYGRERWVSAAGLCGEAVRQGLWHDAQDPLEEDRGGFKWAWIR